MNQFETNQIKSRLRRLELSEEFVDQYVHKLQVNCESYQIACKTIDQWQKKDSREVVSQVLACGIIAAVLGGFLATI
jgi:predicted KAP-like P-loop ATPase